MPTQNTVPQFIFVKCALPLQQRFLFFNMPRYHFTVPSAYPIQGFWVTNRIHLTSRILRTLQGTGMAEKIQPRQTISTVCSANLLTPQA